MNINEDIPDIEEDLERMEKEKDDLLSDFVVIPQEQIDPIKLATVREGLLAIDAGLKKIDFENIPTSTVVLGLSLYAYCVIDDKARTACSTTWNSVCYPFAVASSYVY